MSTNYDPDFCPCCPGVLLYGDPCPFCGDDCPDCHPAVEPEPLRVICAWCPGFDATDPANIGASHGMCEPCLVKWNAELDAEEWAHYTCWNCGDACDRRKPHACDQEPTRDVSGRLVAPPQPALPVRVTMAYPMREGM